MKSSLSFFLVILSFVLYANNEDHFQLAQEYFLKNDYEKAKFYYDKINHEPAYLSQLYENYRTCLNKLKHYKEADKYYQKLIKAYPNNLQYAVDYILNDFLWNQNSKNFENRLRAEEKKHEKNNVALRDFAQALIHRNLNEQAISVMTNAQKNFNEQALFALDIANLYLKKQDKKNFIHHLLVYVKKEPSQLEYTQNLLQNQLHINDYDELENQLYPLLSDKSTLVYNELITWLYIQKKDFYNAFIQLRALDKKANDKGKRLLELASLAEESIDFDNAIVIYQHIQNTYPMDYNGFLAEKLKIGAKRQKIENTYPVETNLLQSILTDYNNLLIKTTRIEDQVDIKRQMARLQAFYMAQHQESIQNLESLINNPRINTLLRSQCKLELGDIYTLINQPWDAALLYYQVEKDFETAEIGHLAKLRNAKLAYFKGEFELAQAHLDILKEATTRQIANDAMALSLLIKDNLALDTSDAALKIYALADLYQYQGNVNEAIRHLDELIKTFPQHSLIDEAYFKKGQIFLSKGKYDEALANFKTVAENYKHDILADDALYAMAYTYEMYLKNLEQAKAVYRSILTNHPGSVFVVDARKRYRLLRGDKI